MANNDTTTPTPEPPNNSDLILKLLPQLLAPLEAQLNNIKSNLSAQINDLNNLVHNK